MYAISMLKTESIHLLLHANNEMWNVRIRFFSCNSEAFVSDYFD